MSNHVSIKQLTTDFYNENTHLLEVLDKNKETGKIEDKGRGYGVFIVPAFGHNFAIPLRSGMTHKMNFTTKTSKNFKKQTIRKGLDYTKALIINEERYLSQRSFRIPSDEFKKINNSQIKIISDFEKFVNHYVTAFSKNDQNILKAYTYSTLQNYHAELGLLVTTKENS